MTTDNIASKPGFEAADPRSSHEPGFTHLFIIGTTGQLLLDLPAVILLVRSANKPADETAPRSSTHTGLISAAVGMFCALILTAVRRITIGHLIGGGFMGGVPAYTQSLALGSPWNMISASLVLLAYGPGEGLFVVYLIRAFDKGCIDPGRRISRA